MRTTDPTTSTPYRPRRPLQREDWGIRFLTDKAEVRLLWFYHAGGTASSLLSTIPHLPASWEIWVPEYPGRGFCAQLAPPGDFDQLVANLSHALPKPTDGIPTILFGHSMGGLVAFEYLHTLSNRAQFPTLVVSCTQAPVHRKPRNRPFEDAELLDHLTGMGKTPSILLQDPSFLRAAIQLMRHDYQLVDTYRARPRAPLDTPLHVLAAASDPVISAAELGAWDRETRAGFELTELRGGHFYYAEDPELFSSTLQRLAARAVGGAPRAHASR